MPFADWMSPSWIIHLLYYNIIFFLHLYGEGLYVCLFGVIPMVMDFNIHRTFTEEYYIKKKLPVLLYHRDCGLFFMLLQLCVLFCFGSKNCVYFQRPFVSVLSCYSLLVGLLLLYFFFFQRVVKLFIFSILYKTHTHKHTHTHIFVFLCFPLPS